MRKFVLIFSFFSLVFCAFQPAPAQAGLLEFFFPSLRKKEYDPAEKMIAPFAVGEEAEEKEKLAGLPINAVPLDKPHLVNSEIADWVMNAAGEVMNFTGNDFDTEMAGRERLFDPTGRKQYKNFLLDKNVLKVIESERYSVRSYAENTPLLLNEGVVNDRYRWLYQVPMVMTYMDKNMKGYKGNDPITQRAAVNIQIGRINDPSKPEGLQIEQWSGKISPMNNDEEKKK